MLENNTINIYTDGACLGNPGPGGWAYLYYLNNKKIFSSGGEKNTTNNRMELTAAIKSLQNISNAHHVILHTDSKYLINGAKEWLEKWKLNNWKSSSKQKVKNIDLWKQLDELLQSHNVDWTWIKGHSGDRFNEEVDEMARNEASLL